MLEMRETFWLECPCGNSYNVRGTVAYHPCEGWKVEIEEIMGCCDLQPDARMICEELQAQIDHEEKAALKSLTKEVLKWKPTRRKRPTTGRPPRLFIV